jgi:hypothetical protein
VTFEQRVSELGLQLPPEPLVPKGVRARTAIGVAASPLNLAVIMSAEVVVAS